MSRKRQSRTLGYGNLEDKCLLAADVGMCGVTNDLVNTPEPEVPVQDVSTESNADLMDRFCAANEDGTNDDAPNLIEEDLGNDCLTGTEEVIQVDPETSETEVQENETDTEGDIQAEPVLDETTETDVVAFDLADGTDGMFGLLDSESPNQTVTMETTESGTIELIIAADFGGGDTNLEVVDADGNLIASSSVDGLSGFQKIAFDVDSEQTYNVTVSTDLDASGEFQLTAHFEADAVEILVDQHVDVIGEDATQLDLDSGTAAISGVLETAGDVDVFQFQAPADGEVSLFAEEMTDGNEQDVAVTISDALGTPITNGVTNEFIELKTDLLAGETYFVSIASTEGTTGSYNLGLIQELPPAEEELPCADEMVDVIENQDEPLLTVEITANEPNHLDRWMETLESRRERFHLLDAWFASEPDSLELV
ncbi:MAG: hypothetical protein AAFN77_08930 [Planctomycetota bacterium]